MIKFENTEVWGFGNAIRGMRNPMNSWNKSDSKEGYISNGFEFIIGKNDLNLMKKLIKAGTDHRKFMRQIMVSVDITAPLYWYKEFDTYKVGTVANSCSTMHKIADKEFTLDDFSSEHLRKEVKNDYLLPLIDGLNIWRAEFINTKDKECWWQMIQILPSSYNQKRTLTMNYEVLANIYKSRKNHKLDEWKEHNASTCSMITSNDCKNPKEYLLCNDCSVGKGFCDWIKTLPYSELITGME